MAAAKKGGKDIKLATKKMLKAIKWNGLAKAPDAATKPLEHYQHYARAYRDILDVVLVMLVQAKAIDAVSSGGGGGPNLPPN